MVPVLGTEEGTGWTGTGSETGKGSCCCSQIGHVSGQDGVQQEVETEAGAKAAVKPGPDVGASPPPTGHGARSGPGPSAACTNAFIRAAWTEKESCT